MVIGASPGKVFVRLLSQQLTSIGRHYHRPGLQGHPSITFPSPLRLLTGAAQHYHNRPADVGKHQMALSHLHFLVQNNVLPDDPLSLALGMALGRWGTKPDDQVHLSNLDALISFHGTGLEHRVRDPKALNPFLTRATGLDLPDISDTFAVLVKEYRRALTRMNLQQSFNTATEGLPRTENTQRGSDAVFGNLIERSRGTSTPPAIAINFGVPHYIQLGPLPDRRHSSMLYK